MIEMPQDLELEKMLIGNVLLSKRLSVLEKSISVIDFYSIPHQNLWSKICEMDEDGESIEITSLASRADVPLTELTRMAIGLPGDTRAADIKRLKDLATLREMIRTYSKLARRAEAKEDVSEILLETSTMVEQIQGAREAEHGTSQHIIEVMENEVFPRLDKFVSGEMVKVPFGFERLDNSTNGGASLGELVVYGALPKSGKSNLMLQTARNQAEMGIPALVASLEMMNYENGFRFLSQSSDQSMNVFRPDMYDTTAERLKAHGREKYNIPLRFDQKVRTVKDLSLEVARLKDAEGLTCVFVDYVQLINPKNKSDNRAAKIEEIIYDLKDLAMRHEIVVYTAAQFNREGIKSEKPTMAHFDGSSAIEKAANLVLLWTLEKEYSRDIDGRAGTLWIEAGRSVAHDSFDIVFQGRSSKFKFI